MKRLTAGILSLVMLLALCGCGKKDGETTWQEQYDLGVRYLSEGNYEEAVIAFTAAIEIDPKRPEAYLGLADAYTGAGDLDAARKALEDGLAATGDAELQARLDELSAEAGNLTGQPPFTLQDLEDWGYPYGIDAYTLEREGKIETGRIEELCESENGDLSKLEGRGIDGNGLSFALGRNMKIWLIDISADDGDTAEGPRGLHLGMSAEDALNLFRCDNPDAIKYVQSGDKSLLTSQAVGESPGIYLYGWHMDENNTQAYAYADEFTGTMYLGKRGHYEDGVLIDEERVILNYEVIELASLRIDVTDGIISEIEVEYWNLN